MMPQKQETQQQTLLTEANQDYGRELKLHAFFKVNNRATSEDLVQETFMKTWIYLVKGGKIDIMKAFLYHILNDLIVDEYRRHKTSSLDMLIEKGFDFNDRNPKCLYDILDGKAAIILIPLLPTKYREVIHMRYVRFLSLKEISLLTGQSKNTVTVQVHRGLKKLKLLYNHV
ncbi:MAG: hypothetical protein A2V60_01035 [Candidatus Portnoybacteria bacterium RIFCSPHIGHO2_01_FULL_39_19]|nr:MAG: hypothetical protein A2V60_01035 [Candidatus Portnoybacteria bacterium RIFCSPHIGHO2_01_FULL_39_19]